MTEQRDDRGRLVSVVVDGQRFHRPPGVELCRLTVENEQLAESLERVTEARDAFKDERNSAVAEVRSLRGVVQAAEAERDALRSNVIDVIAAFYDGAIRNMNEFIRQLRAALAAAADAPQPAPELRCERPGGCVCDPFRRSPDCRWSVGPSPAVLPQPSEDQQR